jgi:tetratricopeptide (TPR) repeat protein
MASPSAEVEQKIGLCEVEVEYSRPAMKGRSIFGGLVPYNEMWRTGANKATAVEFSDKIMLNGKEIPAGKYSLFTIPGEKEWTIILNKNTEMWGTGGYKQEEDVIRLTAAPVTLPNAVENFTIDFSNVSSSAGKLNIYWEKTLVSVNLEHDYREKAMANIQEALKAPDASHNAYESAAEFYMDNNLDAKQALEWAKKSVEMKEVFWNVYTLSRALKLNGMDDQALKAAQRSLTLAEEAKYQTYIDLNKKNIADWSK